MSATSSRGRHISATKATGTRSSRTKHQSAAPRVLSLQFFLRSALNVCSCETSTCCCSSSWEALVVVVVVFVELTRVRTFGRCHRGK